MRYGYFTILSLLLFCSCNIFNNIQTIKATVPAMGSLGYVKGGLFSKEFQKVGHPHLKRPISVSLNSFPFDKGTYDSYSKFRKKTGRPVSISYVDSLELKPRYYRLKITDKVGLTRELNDEENRGLIGYSKHDRSQQMLTEITFVTQMDTEQLLSEAENVFIVEKQGQLKLHISGGFGDSIIQMSSLQVFDFKTSGFCWANNKYGRPEIAVLVDQGDFCPSDTKRNVDKLENKTFLKI